MGAGSGALDERLPTTVVVGFTGAGKTTLMRHWLATKPAGERWAIVLNDLGDALPGSAAVQVAGGCACCTGRLALGTALNRLLRGGPWHRLLIELSGAGHPGPLVDLLRSGAWARQLRIDEIVAVVDASRLEAQLCGALAPLAVAQIEAADRVVVNRCEQRPAAGPVAPLLARLREWPPFARRVEASVDGRAAPPSQGPEPEPDGSGGPLENRYLIDSERSLTIALAWRWPAERHFDRTCLVRAIGHWRALPGLSRATAAFRTARDWYCWRLDAGQSSWEPTGWRRDNRIELLIDAAPAAEGVGTVDRIAAAVEEGLLAALRPVDHDPAGR